MVSLLEQSIATPFHLRTAVCALLSIGAAVSAGCIGQVSDAGTAEVESRSAALQAGASASPAAPVKEVDPSIFMTDPCPSGQVTFNAKCRDTDFFQRFVSPDAALLGVVGPSSKSVDVGVLVIEGFGSATMQVLRVGPGKLADGAPIVAGKQYRAGYPIVGIETIQEWEDEGTRANVFYAQEGTTLIGSGIDARPGFGVISWTHYTETISGYIISSSDGTSLQAYGESSGSSTSECGSSGAFAGWALLGACMVWDGIGSSLLSLAAGTVTFMVVAAPTGGLDAPVAGGAAGVSAVSGFGNSFVVGELVCTALSDTAAKEVKSQCENLAAKSDADDIKFAPMLPSIDTPSTGECPIGMIRYTGLATDCSKGHQVTVDGVGADGIETVEVDYVCAVETVHDRCVLP